jgi:hypothetical protein
MLIAVRLLHTIVWVAFVTSLVFLFHAAWTLRLKRAAWLTAIILAETLLLLLNHWRCPLTDLAALYTSDRSDAFDIYLPGFIARYNKLIFGSFFIVSELLLGWRWITLGRHRP